MDSINQHNDFYALSSFGNVLICSGGLTDAKTVTFPNGYNLDSNLSFKVVFPNGHNCNNASTNMTLNDIPVVVNKYGTLIPLPIHTLREGGSTVYKSVQPNTVLEMYYTSNYDGSNNPAFVVVGNPTVLSSANYTIYADGQSSLDLVLPINSVYVQFPNQSSPNDLWGKISQWTELNYDGAFFRASGTNASTFNSGMQGDLVKNHVHNMNHIHDRGNMNIWGNAGSYLASYDAFGEGALNPNVISTNKSASGGSGVGWAQIQINTSFNNGVGWTGYTGGTRNPDWNNPVEKQNTEGNDPNGIENRPKNYTIKIWKRTA